MSAAELLLTGMVALIVFGPSRLPMLARHLGLFYKKAGQLKEQLHSYWDDQLKELQLLENTGKAEEADKQYSATEQDEQND